MDIPQLITVGITSRFASPSLVETCRSIRHATGFAKGRIILVNDHVPFSDEQKRAFEALDVEYYENLEEQSIQGKMVQVLEMTKTPYLFFTQDDVRFDPELLIRVSERLADQKTTIASIKNEPVPGKTVVGKALVAGVHFTNAIIKNWNNGDCYLAFVGRTMIFRTDWAKDKLFIDMQIVGADTQLYLENQNHMGTFLYIENATLYYRCPESLSEQRRKSSRFFYLADELRTHYPRIDSVLRIPKQALFRAALQTCIHEPVWFALYVLILLYNRLFPLHKEKIMTQFWNPDTTTQKL